jgi:hypothetical protein
MRFLRARAIDKRRTRGFITKIVSIVRKSIKNSSSTDDCISATSQEADCSWATCLFKGASAMKCGLPNAKQKIDVTRSGSFGRF